jgi:hypothetical protein
MKRCRETRHSHVGWVEILSLVLISNDKSEKGKLLERVGRKTTGLKSGSLQTMVAELPGKTMPP